MSVSGFATVGANLYRGTEGAGNQIYIVDGSPSAFNGIVRNTSWDKARYTGTTGLTRDRSGPYIALLSRYTNTSNFYAVTYFEGTSIDRIRVKDSNLDNSNTTGQISFYSSNGIGVNPDLKYENEDTSLKVWVRDVLRISTTDSNHTTGKVGFAKGAQFNAEGAIHDDPVWEEILVPVVISDVSPASGETVGGTSITITGTGFKPASEDPTVTIDGNLCASVVATSTTITCDTPAGSVGAKTLQVTNSDAQSDTDTFTYVVTPVSITTVNPSSGPVEGSTSITITGTGFKPGVTDPTVTIDGNNCTDITASNTTITCTTPAGSEGAKNLIVTNSDTENDTDTFTYISNDGFFFYYDIYGG